VDRACRRATTEDSNVARVATETPLCLIRRLDERFSTTDLIFVIVPEVGFGWAFYHIPYDYRVRAIRFSLEDYGYLKDVLGSIVFYKYSDYYRVVTWHIDLQRRIAKRSVEVHFL